MKPLLYDYPSSICCQMTRLTLAEKGVVYDKHNIDIIEKREQFEPWYTALNAKAVVPTLRLGDEVITDTKVIVPRIDADFEGPSLTPTEPRAAEAMRSWMNEIMAIHYGVLLYSRKLDDNRVAPIVAKRREMLIALREERPEAEALLTARIESNERFQKILKDPAEVKKHEDGVQELVTRLDAELRGHDFVIGDDYTLADTFATAAIARFDVHDYARWWADGKLPGIDAYYERVRARPSWNSAGVIGR